MRPSPSAPSPRRVLLALVGVLLLLVTACGSSSNAPDQDAARDAGSDSDEGDTADDGPIRLTDARGEVVLDEPATDVVTLDFTYTEMVLALGVTPVGVADVGFYRDYVHQDPPLPEEGVTDLGLRSEPSTDRIRSLQPDLIITTTLSLPQVDVLEGIAPVLFFDPSTLDDPMAEMRSTFATVGAALGRDAEAEAVLAELDERLESGRREITDAGLDGTEIVVAQGVGSIEAPLFRLFTDRSLIIQVATEIGLANAWDGPASDWGYTDSTLEGLTQVGDAWFLAIALDEHVDAFEETYASSPVVQNLPFVQNGRFRALGGDAWPWGGPRSAIHLVDRFVTVLEDA
mgnify:FL=1